VPAQQGLGLYDDESVSPRLHTTGQDDQQSPVSGCTADAFHAALQHDKLLAEQGILGNQRPLAAGQVGQGVHDETCRRGRGGCPQALAEGVQDAVAEAANTLEEGSKHGAAP